ncbi:MAG: GNAT family N-acetyltransferase [Methanobacteriaceae archaeon]
MQFEKFEVTKHNPYQVAELIYEADADTFDFFYKNKAKSAEVIEKLVRADVNNLNHQSIYVVTDDEDHLLGVTVIHHGIRPNFFYELKSILKNLSLLDGLKYTMISLLDKMLLSDLKDQDSYLAIVAVDEVFRGRGIGSFILEKAVELIYEHGSKRAVLDVDIDNPGALRLYEKFGFKIFKKKSLALWGWEKGVFNMELKL